MPEQKPSVGRIVHFQTYGTPDGEFKSLPRAAVITEVHSDTKVGLCVLNPRGIYFTTAEYEANGEQGTWRWPPRV